MEHETWDELRSKRDDAVNSAVEVAIELICRPSDDKTLTSVRVALFKTLVTLANQYTARMDEAAKKEIENERGE